ncbi:MAG: alpha/beta fold hydrolase [Acidimicrobiales bacterium]
MERFRLTAEDGSSSACYRWAPGGSPAAVVVLAHGMGEHALRYDRLALALGATGYETFALDHRGHGRTATGAKDLGVLGAGGWRSVVDDYARLVTHARSVRPDVPAVAFGHSFGSFVVQDFLLDHGARVDAAVLSGSSALDQVKVLVDPTAPMDLTTLNAPFAPARTDFDWLSRDDAEVDAYIADPLCGFGLEPAGLSSWLAAADRLVDPAALVGIGAGFPIYLVSGGSDPINASYAWLDILADRYVAAGVTVTKAYYDGARHEVFNEVNRDEITNNLVAWLGGVDRRRPEPSAASTS